MKENQSFIASLAGAIALLFTGMYFFSLFFPFLSAINESHIGISGIIVGIFFTLLPTIFFTIVNVSINGFKNNKLGWIPLASYLISLIFLIIYYLILHP